MSAVTAPVQTPPQPEIDAPRTLAEAPPTPELPPGPGYPRPLQTLGWVRRPFAFMERCHERYGDMFTLRIAQEGTWVFLAHPDYVKQVFTAAPTVLHAGEGNRILGPVLGSSSVLLLDEKPHMRERKLLLPPFHGERMQRYGDLMAEIARDEIDSWPTGEPLALWPRMQDVTLEVIMRAVFGVEDVGRLAALRAELTTMLKRLSTPTTMAMLATLGPERMKSANRITRVLEPVDKLIYEELDRRRAADDLADREDILSLLLQARYEDGSPMEDKALRDELMTLLVAGHETTATSLAWAVERLVRHPDKWEKLRADDESGTYADAVTKETLRLRPVLPIVVRRLTQDWEVGGRVLPKGATVAPCIHLIHRREDVYPDPRAFRPERFLERPAGTYTWIPFGGGVRRCLGASFAQFEMKVVLRELAARTTLRAVAPEPERVSRRAITLTPSEGATVIVERAA
jgi:cytochrome P450 family 135